MLTSKLKTRSIKTAFSIYNETLLYDSVKPNWFRSCKPVGDCCSQSTSYSWLTICVHLWLLIYVLGYLKRSMTVNREDKARLYPWAEHSSLLYSPSDFCYFVVTSPSYHEAPLCQQTYTIAQPPEPMHILTFRQRLMALSFMPMSFNDEFIFNQTSLADEIRLLSCCNIIVICQHELKTRKMCEIRQLSNVQPCCTLFVSYKAQVLELTKKWFDRSVQSSSDSALVCLMRTSTCTCHVQSVKQTPQMWS